MDTEKIEKQTKQKIEYFKQINSTHLYAKEIENVGDSILIAEKQTGGIGTKGRTWYTGQEKNIALTIIKHPKCKVDKLEGLTTLIAEKIKESIEELYGYKLQIKVPNDLILNNKKICGILTEIHTQGEKIEYLLISIGFNVNEEKFSEDTKDIATSLRKETNKIFLREEIIQKWIEKVEKILDSIF